MKDDFYETPAWCVRRYLDFRHAEYGYDLTLPWTWIEPSAGNGAIIRAVNSWAPPFKPRWVAVEIEATHYALPETGVQVLFADFLHPDVTITANRKFDLCIGNPPFKLAREFIEKGLTVAREVAFLLRLNFLEGAKRAKFFQKYTCDVHVLPNRPSFRSDGHTDATAYAWFEFGEGHDGRVTVLATTPKAERLADRVKAI